MIGRCENKIKQNSQQVFEIKYLIIKRQVHLKRFKNYECLGKEKFYEKYRRNNCKFKKTEGNDAK